MMKIILLSIIALILLIIIFYACYGGFRKIQPKLADLGGEILVYEEMKGDYKNSREVMDRVYYSLLNNHKIETFKGFGIYYDDPGKVDKEKLRSDVGCILEEENRDRIDDLKNEFKVKILPEAKYVVVEFPLRGKFSVFIGIMKVYPAINQFVRKNGYPEEGPVMEIYDTPGKKIYYRKIID